MTSEHFQVLSLLLFCVLHSSEQTCPSKCFCMSDTVRCSSVGLHELPQSLPSFPTNLDFSHNHIIRLDPDTLTMTPRLEKLWMAHNEIRTLSHNVFRNVSGLRLLDLSSNRLQMVEQHYFQGLWRLEELRLFNNRITQVEGSSLSGLSSLKKVYFSFNQITHFPFFFIQDHTHPFLAMLDLSSNRMSSLPWEDVKALPQLVQQGLYTHNNSFICNCSMYDMFRHWNLSKYNSIKDFTDEHTCNVNGDPCKSIRFFRDNGFFQNCTEKPIIQPETDLPDVVVFEGNRVHLDCQTSISSTNLSFTWLSPSRGFITQSSMNDTRINMFPDGTLEIHATTTNDSGVYLCTAVDIKQALNATCKVKVIVLLRFHTGYTTLLGCIVTLVLILAYLFLTPCHCSFCKQPPVHSNQGTLSCIFSYFTRKQPNTDTLKHVAFMEHPMGEDRIEWIPQS